MGRFHEAMAILRCGDVYSLPGPAENHVEPLRAGRNAIQVRARAGGASAGWGRTMTTGGEWCVTKPML